MSAERGRHLPVLLDEVLGALDPKPGETLVDCTAGLGGHAAAIATRLGPTGQVLLVDVDPANLAPATDSVRLRSGAPQVRSVAANFASVEAITAREGLRADLLLADLGFSSNQMADPLRGLSFAADAPLDMRLDPSLSGTAADLVAALPERSLADLIFELGEEPLARRIAKRLVEARRTEAITTTAQLARLVREAYGSRAASSRMNPATRTFMALRIAVNDELGALERLLDSIERGAADAASDRESWLSPACRVAIISFHSLEDRLVKRRFRAIAKSLETRGAETSRKPVEASEEESRGNPRSRSAKLRILRLRGRC